MYTFRLFLFLAIFTQIMKKKSLKEILAVSLMSKVDQKFKKCVFDSYFMLGKAK